MKLIYFDEQAGRLDGSAFTAVHGVIIDPNSMLSAREEFYVRFQDLLGLPKEVDGVKHSHILPILHGSDLLSDYSDAVKLQAVRLIFDVFVSAGARFFRVGYFDKSVAKILSTKEQRIEFCAFQLLMTVAAELRESHMLIHEIDKRSLARSFRLTSDHLSLYHSIGSGLVSIDFRNYIGHYLASKNDIACQMADLVGYVAFKAETSVSPFSKSLADIHVEFGHYYSFNEIIRMTGPM